MVVAGPLEVGVRKRSSNGEDLSQVCVRSSLSGQLSHGWGLGGEGYSTKRIQHRASGLGDIRRSGGQQHPTPNKVSIKVCVLEAKASGTLLPLSS